jgi:hypothetical protein
MTSFFPEEQERLERWPVGPCFERGPIVPYSELEQTFNPRAEVEIEEPDVTSHSLD